MIKVVKIPQETFDVQVTMSAEVARRLRETLGPLSCSGENGWRQDLHRALGQVVL